MVLKFIETTCSFVAAALSVVMVCAALWRQDYVSATCYSLFTIPVCALAYGVFKELRKELDDEIDNDI